jgi:hypothetical protein
MAIGNAPWPIGVTMVGIHARTGREKIFAQHVARILLKTVNSVLLAVSALCQFYYGRKIAVSATIYLNLFGY